MPCSEPVPSAEADSNLRTCFPALTACPERTEGCRAIYIPPLRGRCLGVRISSVPLPTGHSVTSLKY